MSERLHTRRHLRGHRGNERGRDAERRALCLLWERPPRWLRSVRAAHRAEDCRGVDLVAQTDIGPCEIQVKASHTGVLNGREKALSAGRVIVAVPPEVTDALARRWLLVAIERWRAERRVN